MKCILRDCRDQPYNLNPILYSQKIIQFVFYFLNHNIYVRSRAEHQSDQSGGLRWQRRRCGRRWRRVRGEIREGRADARRCDVPQFRQYHSGESRPDSAVSCVDDRNTQHGAAQLKRIIHPAATRATRCRCWRPPCPTSGRPPRAPTAPGRCCASCSCCPPSFRSCASPSTATPPRWSSPMCWCSRARRAAGTRPIACAPSWSSCSRRSRGARGARVYAGTMI